MALYFVRYRDEDGNWYLVNTAGLFIPDSSLCLSSVRRDAATFHTKPYAEKVAARCNEINRNRPGYEGPLGYYRVNEVLR